MGAGALGQACLGTALLWWAAGWAWAAVVPWIGPVDISWLGFSLSFLCFAWAKMSNEYFLYVFSLLLAHLGMFSYKSLQNKEFTITCGNR